MTIKFSDILGCMEEAFSCPSGLQNFMRFPHKKRSTVLIVASIHLGRYNMDKSAGLCQLIVTFIIL